MAAAFVQKATATGVAATSITTPAFGSNTTVGNVIIGACSSSRSSATNTFTFSDSKVNTWNTDVNSNNFHSGGNSCCNAIGSATLTAAGASHTVSCNAGSGTNGYQLVAAEFSGLTTTVDKTATNTGANSSTSVTATTAATANASDLVVGIYSGDTNTTATGASDPPQLNGSTTGVNSLQIVSATTVVSTEAAYSIISSTGTQAVKWTYSADASGVYCAAVAVYQASAGGNVTVALTGQSATSAAGALSPGNSKAITGQGITSASWTLVPATAVAITGQAITSEAGTLAPNAAVAITGNGATFSAGALSAGGNVTASLTGQGVTATAGSLSPATDTAMAGTASTSAIGTIIPGSAISLTGSSASFAQGSLTGDFSAQLSGQLATFALGQLAPVGDITVSLTGISAVFTVGNLSVQQQSIQDAGRRTRLRNIYRITIDGQQFECKTLAEALQLLDRAKSLAEQVAAQAVRQASEVRGNQPKPLAIATPKIEVNTRELRAAVTETKREIANIYRKALIDSEIALLFELDMREKDNEEALIFLM